MRQHRAPDLRVTAMMLGAGLVVVGALVAAFLAVAPGDDERTVSTPRFIGRPTTTSAPPTTAPRAPTTTTLRPSPTTLTTVSPGTVVVVPLPPTTPAPTSPSPTTAPTTLAPATTTTTKPATSATKKAAALRRSLLSEQSLGVSNRGVPDRRRLVVQYAPGETVTVTWAIDSGVDPIPTPAGSCATPVTSTSSTTSTSTSTTSTSTTSTSTSSSSTTLPGPTTTSTTLNPITLSTPDLARYEASRIAEVVKAGIDRGRLDATSLRLVGTFRAGGTGAEVRVVDVTYSRAEVLSGIDRDSAFAAPPAKIVSCLDPAFK